MSFNKKILAVAIVGGLFATSAQAQVDISAANPTPVTYASEIIASATPGVTLTATAANQIQTRLLQNLSAGEVRYARVECSSNVKFGTGTAVTSPNYGTAGFSSVGVINGLNTSAITFSITSGTTTAASANDVLTIAGARTLTSASAATCRYSLYDQPSQASSGGDTGRIVTTGDKSYLAFASSYVFTATSRSSTANVEASPAFTSFVAATSNPPYTSTGTAHLADLNYALAGTVPLKADGNAIALTDLMATGASGTKIVVSGDFSAAANADGTYTGAALGRVFLSALGTNCALGTAASALTATTATFNVGATPATTNLCFTPRAAAAIPQADYEASLNAVSAAPTVYAVTNIGPRDTGEIVRNGTSLQAPLAQVPDGYISRMVLTNTGSVDRPFTISVFGETGNTIGTANLTGVVPANGTIVRDLNTVMTSFTTGQARRGTLNVTVSGPSNQIQGLYQIVFPSTGALSNHVMVRPGQN